jgi:hypothetical protein
MRFLMRQAFLPCQARAFLIGQMREMSAEH